MDRVVTTVQKFLRLATADDLAPLLMRINNVADGLTLVEGTLTNVREVLAALPAFPAVPAEGERAGKTLQYVEDVLTWVVAMGLSLIHI